MIRPPELRDLAFPFETPPKELRGASLDVTFWVRVDGRVERYEVQPVITDRDYARKFDEVIRAFRFTPARAPDGSRIAGTTRVTFTLPGKRQLVSAVTSAIEPDVQLPAASSTMLTATEVLMSRLFLRKSVQDCENDIAERGGLRRSLGKWHLTALGVGATIGAGSSPPPAPRSWATPSGPGAGPAIVLSFLLTAVTCGFAALCYAEFASMVPISGSAYTYAYASLGELVAWIIGWDLIVEYAVGNIGVAIGWSGYFRELLTHFGLALPPWLATDFRSAHMAAEAVAAGATDATNLYLASALTTAPQIFGFTFIANLPAFLIVACITCILVIGIRESATSNNAMVILKVAIILFFVRGGRHPDPARRTGPIRRLGGFAPNGFAGISAGAAIIFFSYIGFDATSTAAEEAKDPARDMPFGIIMSLIICTVLYILVAAVMTGMAPWPKLGTAEPMITALALADGSPGLITFSRFIVSLGAVFAMTSVLLVFQLGQPRIFMSMSRDGLLPPFFSRVHPRFKTPYIGTIITGTLRGHLRRLRQHRRSGRADQHRDAVRLRAGVGGCDRAAEAEPDRPRPFRAPWVPLTPILAIVSCLYLMLQLPWLTWVRFAIWLALGLVIYFLYGIRHSRLARERGVRRKRGRTLSALSSG